MFQVEAVLAGRLDAEQLAMEGGGAWMVCLDVYVLDSDGALLDACLLAAVAALLSLRLPQAHEDTTPQVPCEGRMRCLCRMARSCPLTHGEVTPSAC